MINNLLKYQKEIESLQDKIRKTLKEGSVFKIGDCIELKVLFHGHSLETRKVSIIDINTRIPGKFTQEKEQWTEDNEEFIIIYDCYCENNKHYIRCSIEQTIIIDKQDIYMEYNNGYSNHTIEKYVKCESPI